MKIITILLALVVLPLIAAKIGKNKYFAKYKDTLEARANEKFSMENVHEGSLKLDYLDAQLSGLSPSIDERERIGKAIENIQGVRVTESSNALRVPSEVTFQRKEDGNFILQGIAGLATEDSPSADDIWSWDNAGEIDNNLVKKAWVTDSLVPVDMDAWNDFKSSFFGLSGARSLAWKNKSLILNGQGTRGQTRAWRSALRKAIDPSKTGYNIISKIDIVSSPLPPVAPKKVDAPSPSQKEEKAPLPSKGEAPIIAIKKKAEKQNNTEQSTTKTQTNNKQKSLRNISKALKDNQIYFAKRFTIVRYKEMPKVRNLAKIIKESDPETYFVLGGHSDGSGTRAHNKKVSWNRAEAVLYTLKKLGVDGKKLKIISFGEAKAQAENSKKSRRVELRVR